MAASYRFIASLTIYGTDNCRYLMFCNCSVQLYIRLDIPAVKTSSFSFSYLKLLN